ncbi:hypothetical protein BH11ARM2_BH11ARM2_30510 [soil metagenome]
MAERGKVLAKPIAIKPEEQFARSYVDRLILEKLTEMESVVKVGELAEKLSDDGVGLATVRNLLASNPERFAYHERRWIPASRLESQGRPLAEAISITLNRFGGAMPFETLSAEVGRVRGVEPDAIRETVRRVVNGNAFFSVTAKGEVGLTGWGFVANDETSARAFALNEVDAKEVDDLVAKLGGIDLRMAEGIAEAVKRVAPVSLKLLGAAVWRILNNDDPKSPLVFDDRVFLSQALSLDDFVYASDGTLHVASDSKRWIGAAVKYAEKVAPTVEMEDVNPIEIQAEDVGRLVGKVTASDNSTTAIRLLEENYEVTPGTKTFPDDLANLIGTLRKDDKIVWVGGDRFRRVDTVPDYIHEVPEPFRFEKSLAVDAEGELVDVELTDEGLSTSLRKLLQHPLAMDVVDEDIQPAPKQMPDSIRLVLKSIHRELGTFPMCQLPTAFIDAEPNIQELFVTDASGRDLSVWANHEARLLYGWIDWWLEQDTESGAVFTLTKTTRPNVLEFAWLDQPDPVIYIDSSRMEALRQLGAESEGRSTLDLLINVMQGWPKGADYLTLLAEVNVARRSSRRLIASLLSSYQCFYQRSGSPVWHFDAKKVDLGFDKTKRKFVRK